ncbi:MAG: DUF4398 domain-containing protein [Gammaproteobacteria bacterium]|nr:DUF4398 domain-containing protein [Gammaproteobacteria bacterium]
MILTILINGCASIRAPHENITQAKTSIRNADDAGARTHAPLLFRNAEKKLDSAKGSMQQKEYQQAKMYAERAEIDADLAQFTSRSIKAQKSVDELNESIKMLRKEIGLTETN